MAHECPHCGERLERLVGACPRCRGDLTGAPSADELLGRTIADNFELLSVIGSGAMGRVYRARQQSLDKIVAIKLLHPHLASDPKLAKRFHREARAASRLNQPNSLQIIDFGQDEAGRLYIAMEYLEGLSLGDLIERDFPFSPARIGRILGQVCDALEEAHASGIIHRDLKPDNVLVTDRRGETDHVKVCDFGIAKIQDPKADGTDSQLTMAGLVCGTPEYMSPEQARGDELDGRSDVYALGVIGYQMLCGQVPFTAQTALGVITKHLTDSVVPPSERRPDLGIPTALENVFLRALAKERGDRPESPAALKRELDAAIATLPSPTTRPVAGSLPSMPKAATVLSGEIRAAPGRRTTGVLWASVAIAVMAVTAVGLFAFWDGTAGGAGSRVDRFALGSRGAPPGSPPVVPPPVAADAAVPEVPEVADAAVTAPVVDAGVEPEVPPQGVASSKRGKLSKVTKAPPPDDGTPPTPPQPPTGSETPSPGRRAYDEGRTLFLSGQYAQAIAKYREAERLGFGGPALYKSLGQAYSRVGNTAAMCEAYRRVLRGNPNDLSARGIVDGQCR